MPKGGLLHFARGIQEGGLLSCEPELHQRRVQDATTTGRAFADYTEGFWWGRSGEINGFLLIIQEKLITDSTSRIVDIRVRLRDT